ncbi:hypothetical protein OROGR_022921 [Orobanche gracilis]
MHGRVHRGSERGRRTANTVVLAGDNHSHRAPSITTCSSTESFLQGDGRKISVDGCPLSTPLTDSSLFIGLIHGLALDKVNSLQVGVKWLYRSSELKLGKGTLVDSAPNEIFYSFQKHKVLVASLLYPCKVAFLPRGVKLPTWTSYFICRRAYDIANKSLWWLTDHDYSNDQQAELDQILYKGRKEMHLTLQPGARSPKQNNGPTSISPLKPASDSGQNSGNSCPSQAKGKKRERGEHGSDPSKRGRFTRSDYGDSVHCKTESNLKYEIAKITEKGGVVDLKRIEKLVQLMQPDRKEGKMDLGIRAMFATVLASTDKVDCLNRFVHLRGLPVLDGWLQDIHMGKIGDGNNLKDDDKSVAEFLLVLLRALDKLPINLQALQMCNIGRSVNYLRSHKNMEIQRKARTLVDSWKKHVEAEMISIDAKTGSTQAVSAWPSKTRLPEASYSGSRTPDGAMKSSVAQNSSAKTTLDRSSPGESNIKYATSSPGLVKPASTSASGKESPPRSSVGGIAEVPQIGEDMSSSSNQSYNCGPSLAVKDDLKSSTSGLVSVNKISSTSTRNRKNIGFPGLSATGNQKETSSSKSSPAHKTTALEKLSHSALTGERVSEGPISEGCSHKLIVKIPNRARSPAQDVPIEDPTITGSLASSPVIWNKHEQSDPTSKGKSDAIPHNVPSDMGEWQNNDQKDVLTHLEGAGSLAVHPDEEQSMTTEGFKRLNESTASKLLMLHASSFSPMNALIESCAKYSEATSSLSLEDDVGMNLLASVAAEEMSRSDVVSLCDSTERSTPSVQEVCVGAETKSKYSPENYPAGVHNQFFNDECDGKKQALLDRPDDESFLSKQAPLEFPGDRICAPSHSDDSSKDADVSIMELRRNACNALSTSMENVKDGESNGGFYEEKATSGNVIADGVSHSRNGGTNVMATEKKDNIDHLSISECKLMVDGSVSKPLEEGDCNKFDNKGLNRASISQPKLIAVVVKAEFPEDASNKDMYQCECGHKSVSEAGGSFKVGEVDDKDAKSCMSKSERLESDQDRNAAFRSHSAVLSCSTSQDLSGHYDVPKLENQEKAEHLLPESQYPVSVEHVAQEDELTESRSASILSDETGKHVSTVATDPCEKMKFDLNECFSGDGGECEESANLSTVQMINSLPFSVNSVPTAQPASITVASAAKKGAFILPRDLLRSKVELGWKGSAATSAFRPAEPRKMIEIALGPSNLSCPDTSTCKHDCFPLDIDLNVSDERVLEEIASRGSDLAVESMTDLTSECATLLNEASDFMPLRGSSGGLDLDLNIVDEASNTARCSTSSNHYGEASIMHDKPVSSLHIQRDFDLNYGPSVDDVSVRQFLANQLVKGGVASHFPSMAGLTMNNQGPSSFTSWFSPANTYSAVAIPSALPNQEQSGGQPFPVFPHGGTQRTFIPAGVAPFNPDVYRGSVLSSSPAVPFPSSPFQYPVFPLGTTFPLPSGNFSVGGTSYPDPSSGARIFRPPVNSHYVGPVGIVPSQFQRPYVVGLADVSNNGGLNSNKKLSSQGLDLNAGPGTMDSEVKEGMLPHSSAQHPLASFQTLAEEHARVFSVSCGILKRREPEVGWDSETIRHRHSSWQ